jgi:hypothetical protein
MQHSARFHVTGSEQHDSIAIDYIAVGIGKHGAVGIAVEGHA